MLETWRKRLGIPFSKAVKFCSFKLFLSIPPCIFKALIVATITTALGVKLDNLHFISKNFSAPKSAPKPASVTV